MYGTLQHSPRVYLDPYWCHGSAMLAVEEGEEEEKEERRR